MVRRPLNELGRLVEKIRINDETCCWDWVGARGPKGYGLIRSTTGKSPLAHRRSFEAFREPIPEGLELDHLCRNPSCVNPYHLEPVTHRENVLRGKAPPARLAKRDCCARGHDLTDPGNVYRRPSRPNTRQCRTCMRAMQRAYSQRLRRREARA